MNGSSYRPPGSPEERRRPGPGTSSWARSNTETRTRTFWEPPRTTRPNRSRVFIFFLKMTRLFSRALTDIPDPHMDPRITGDEVKLQTIKPSTHSQPVRIYIHHLLLIPISCQSPGEIPAPTQGPVLTLHPAAFMLEDTLFTGRLCCGPTFITD